MWQQILQSDPDRKPVAAWDAGYKINNTAVVLAASQGMPLSGIRPQSRSRS